MPMTQTEFDVLKTGTLANVIIDAVSNINGFASNSIASISAFSSNIANVTTQLMLTVDSINSIGVNISNVTMTNLMSTLSSTCNLIVSTTKLTSNVYPLSHSNSNQISNLRSELYSTVEYLTTSSPVQYINTVTNYINSNISANLSANYITGNLSNITSNLTSISNNLMMHNFQISTLDEALIHKSLIDFNLSSMDIITTYLSMSTVTSSANADYQKSSLEKIDILTATLETLNKDITQKTLNKDITQQTLNKDITQQTISDDVGTLRALAADKEVGIALNSAPDMTLHSMQRAITVNALKKSDNQSAVSAEMIKPTALP